MTSSILREPLWVHLEPLGKVWEASLNLLETLRTVLARLELVSVRSWNVLRQILAGEGR